MNLSPALRVRVYAIVAAVLPILAAYGLISTADIDQWLVLAAAVVGTAGAGLASANVPSSGRHARQE